MYSEVPSIFSFLVFFIYGLAFLVMGMVLLLETLRLPSFVELRLLLPLSIFGILHGIHEWFEFFLQQALWLSKESTAQILWVRIILLGISFLALGVFGFNACKMLGRGFFRRFSVPLLALGLYLLVILISWASTKASVPAVTLSNNLIRYLIAIPSAFLAMLGLGTQAANARQAQRTALSKNLRLAAIGFGFYGLSQLVVNPAAIFPASTINYRSFFNLTGIPIEVLRSTFALLIAFGMLRATNAAEQERKETLIDAQEARVRALENAQQEMAARKDLQQKLLRYTVHAQEEERARISRELHDETAQILSAFSLELAALRNRLGEEPERLAPSLNRLQILSKDMSQGIYRLVHDLRPAQLDDLGLVPAIQNLIGEECCKMALDVSLHVSGTSQRVNPQIETVLYRVAQAALTNVSRHAHSQQAEVQICFEEQHVVMQIIDNGIGFDPAEPLIAPRGWGLEGMKERVASVSGEFKIRSTPQKGTTVTAIIPYSPTNKEQD